MKTTKNHKKESEKSRFKRKKSKTIIFTSLTFFTFSIVIIFVSLLVNQQQSNTSNVDANNYLSKDGVNIDLTKELLAQQAELNKLIDWKVVEKNDTYTHYYFFSDTNIKNNIFAIINVALQTNETFSDSPNNYSKRLKYRIEPDQKQVICNLFLYNKTITSKKFVSNFKLSI